MHLWLLWSAIESSQTLLNTAIISYSKHQQVNRLSRSALTVVLGWRERSGRLRLWCRRYLRKFTPSEETRHYAHDTNKNKKEDSIKKRKCRKKRVLIWIYYWQSSQCSGLDGLQNAETKGESFHSHFVFCWDSPSYEKWVGQ